MSILRNSVQLIGHLGANPEVKTIGNGKKMANFSMATSERYQTNEGEWKENTQWHRVVVWDPLSEKVEQQLQKGSFVMIQGKLVNRSYEDAAGVKKYITEIQALNFMSLDKKTAMVAEPE